MEIIKAYIKNKKIYVDNTEVKDIEILSNGQDDSKGYITGHEGHLIYLTIPMKSIEKTIDKVIDVVSQIKNITSELGNIGNYGTPTEGWSVPPVIPNKMVVISENLEILNNKLNELKGNLQ